MDPSLVKIVTRKSMIRTIPTTEHKFAVAESSFFSWSLFSSPLQIVVDSKSAKIKAAPEVFIFFASILYSC